ncbi:DUF6069 family protein [Actinoplanes sp. GCM10030250]|uniref:DUF6069 family protein n=1 Tax=Actinoplanes sp. GCM10030250 TaxID=3273376 RepID=UPI003621CAF2
MTDTRNAPAQTRTMTIRQYRLAVTGAAVAAAEAAYLVIHYGAGVDLALHSGTTVGAASVAVAALVAALAGWALLAVLERFTKRARTVWTVVAAVVYGLSLLGPVDAVSTSAVVGLDILHAVVAVVLIGALPRPCFRR